MKDIQTIGGVIPALVTCFDQNGNYDEKRQRDMVEFLIQKGVDGLYLTGSTGEAFLMDAGERRAVVETVIDQNRGRVPLIVHVGDIGTKKSIAFAQHAWEAGADAISSVPPFYFKFTSAEILSYYQAVSEATPLPMIIYNIALAGLVNWESIVKLAQLPNVKGIKYTATTHFEIARMKQEIGRDFRVYSGCDEMALSGFSFGADGIIGSFYNVILEPFLQMRKALQAGELKEAENCQQVADAVILFVLQFPYFAAMKRMAAWMGHDAGFVREPFASLNAAQEAQLISGLAHIRDTYGSCGMEVLEKLPVQS